jgi:hypothetical protein
MVKNSDCKLGQTDGWRTCPLSDKIDMMLESQRRIEEAVIGDGSANSGLLVRVSLLEQSEVKRVWAVRAALGAGLTAICGFIVSLLKG